MKKYKILFIILVFVFPIITYFREAGNVDINYGNSDVYKKQDIDKAVSIVKKEFSGFQGCELYSLAYAGDEASANELEYQCSYSDKKYTACIVLNSSFRSPKNGGGAWEPDTEYKWQWIVVKEDNGPWFLLDYGYC